MNFWDRQWFGPVAAIRPYLLQRCFMLLVAVDAIVLMAERGSRYGLDALQFNVAHFAWLDALHRTVLPTGVPSANYYVCILMLTSFFAFTLVVTGHRPLLTFLVLVLFSYAWSMSRLDSYLHHYMVSLILACLVFFPRVDVHGLHASVAPASDRSPATRRNVRSKTAVDRRIWGFVGLSLGLAVLYRGSLSRLMGLSDLQRWLSMFLGVGLFTVLVYRLQKGLRMDHGPLVGSWAFRLLGVTVGVIYVFTAMAKMDAEWCGGHTLRQVGATADVLKPVEQLAGRVGISGEWFWSILATLVIPLELTLAVSYMLAVRQDEPGRTWLRRWCSVAWLLAIGLHLNNEMMNLVIQWFGYYMLFLATLILLPARLVLAVGLVLIWPEAWLRRRYDSMLEARSAGQRTGILAVASLFALLALIPGGLYMDLPGALWAACILASGLVIVLVADIVAGGEKQLVGVSVTTAIAALLMVGSAAQCSMRFDYYDLRGKTLQQMGRHEEAIRDMEKAADLGPPSPAAAAELYTNLGLSHRQLGELKTARAPSTDEAEQHFQIAERYYRTAMELDPRAFLAHYSLANLLIKRERHEAAEYHYRQALAIKPDFSDAYANLGGLLEFQGRIFEAIENYQRALQIEPGARDVQQHLENAKRKRKLLREGTPVP